MLLDMMSSARPLRLSRLYAASGHAATAAECGQQFPPSDGDCHTPLPCEVRKWNDSTPRACSLAVQGGRMLVASTSVVASTALLPPPTLSECRHSALARRGIAVRRDVDLQGSLCEGLR